MRTVFGKSQQEAIATAALIEARGAVPCGPYPGAVRSGNVQQRQVADPLQRPPVDDHERVRRCQPPLRSVRSPEGRDGDYSLRHDGLAMYGLPARRASQLGRIAEPRVSIRLCCARLAFHRRVAQPDRDAGTPVSRPHACRRSGRDRQAAHRPDPLLRDP
ncbi:hypothetical protein [Bradyrhizobium sp. USDA 4350]